ncbi:rhodanese-like domain-containing protein [Aquiflexum gelatinilyticum]|uniref:rhodanese-like domain-containing protein n=1 Tax=Aquiflexum gelatinilyticum TaxID=2961943 RepID=UPI002167BABB|nr:rhodanese-like domain-containing protein [Aquiflexum gelatinilyticum]MCS4433167.1 rhodanese-like domain-containing protein [Aquiflexum gelatinilyticum]
MKQIFIFLFLAAILVSCNSNTSDTSSVSGKMEEVDAATFKNLMASGNGIVLDVRTPEEVAQGIIPDAYVIDIYQSGFEEKLQSLPKDKEVYVYCAVGGRSRQAAEILLNNGFTKVYNLSGGIVDWRRNGFEVVKPD